MSFIRWFIIGGSTVVSDQRERERERERERGFVTNRELPGRSILEPGFHNIHWLSQSCCHHCLYDNDINIELTITIQPERK